MSLKIMVILKMLGGHVEFIFILFTSCQKITLEELSDSKSVVDEKSMKSAEHSVNSLATATHETSNVAVYEVGYCSFFLWVLKHS